MLVELGCFRSIAKPHRSELIQRSEVIAAVHVTQRASALVVHSGLRDVARHAERAVEELANLRAAARMPRVTRFAVEIRRTTEIRRHRLLQRQCQLYAGCAIAVVTRRCQRSIRRRWWS